MSLQAGVVDWREQVDWMIIQYLRTRASDDAKYRELAIKFESDIYRCINTQEFQNDMITGRFDQCCEFVASFYNQHRPESSDLIITVFQIRRLQLAELLHERNLVDAQTLFARAFGFVKEAYGGTSWTEIYELLKRETALLDWRRSDHFQFCSSYASPFEFRPLLAKLVVGALAAAFPEVRFKTPRVPDGRLLKLLAYGVDFLHQRCHGSPSMPNDIFDLFDDHPALSNAPSLR